MFKIAVVIFRECLEIALLMGVILAVTKPVKNSRFFIILGCLTGVVMASTFAFFTRSISQMLDGFGDEVFDASIILITSLIISWTVVWMQGYTKKIRQSLDSLSDKICTGKASRYMLALVVATTIFREGAEIMLFIYSISSAENIAINDYAIGLALGSIGGFGVGFILYRGLIGFAGKYIFKVSTMLLILISAGLASEAAGILTSTGVIEIFSDALWDSSWLVEDRSITGKLLNITTGYDSKPNGMQIIFYAASIILTFSMIKLRELLSKDKETAEQKVMKVNH